MLTAELVAKVGDFGLFTTNLAEMPALVPERTEGGSGHGMSMSSMRSRTMKARQVTTDEAEALAIFTGVGHTTKMKRKMTGMAPTHHRTMFSPHPPLVTESTKGGPLRIASKLAECVCVFLLAMI